MAAIVQERIAGTPALAAATADLAARLRASTVEVQTQGHGHGSGVIWREHGLIITNSHVAQTDHPEVILADGRAFSAQVTLRDAERDLAALQIAATGLPAAPIGDSATLRAGQLVLAMGHPLGVTGAMTLGIIHAVGNDHGGQDRWIRADVNLAPGNSGGPLVDAQGWVIGINSMIVGGLALAVPSKAVERFLNGTAQAAFLGAQTQAVALPAAFAQRFGQESGLMVLTLVEHGPAARSGLLPGDILLMGGKQSLIEIDDLIALLRDLEPGTPLPLTVLRGGERGEVTVILGRRPSESR
ncbi:MAG TPA: trypsin-like peptidase domain-containing protein [Chloroflexota bacterium]|jgi:serine protease Do|nr:trypsin-like peptidase domain-containing protein [Chloroflexota bacterium]